MIWAALSWYAAGPIITLNGQITAGDYMLILGNDVVFQDDNSPIHTAISVQSWLRSVKMHFIIFPDQHNRQT
jgi:hypothetical protein